MKFVQIENFGVNPKEVGLVFEDKPGDPKFPRKTVMLVQGCEFRVSIPKAEVEKMLEEGDDGEP